MTLAVHTEGLSRRFDGVTALDGLNLAVPTGSIFGFLGPNGAGKTTTIRLLLGLLEPSSGNAVVLGRDVRRESQAIREQVGVLLDSDGLYERLTARQNLDFFARVARLSKGERDARIRALLEEIDLWDRRDDPVADFSRGMKQKLALARAFLHRPSLLFLDEPTAGLDTPAAVGLRSELVSLAREEGVTVFLTTHNLLEAERVCDRVAVIRQGKLLAEGPPESIRGGGKRKLEVTATGIRPALVARLMNTPEVTGADVDPEGRLILALADGAETAPLIRLMVETGVEVSEARIAEASLEETFLALVDEDLNGRSRVESASGEHPR
ncbi:MAG: ABC transporter ATP-binding protein [marine benthic group bacterium]|nr:ABC transporter ATP-binding protein [Gemmatimonadota bacterium]MCL7979904.1 ABC transporter ATP-binding protein [Gemmatimonadota bacterium]MCL7983069.1 ABC transporter ATP-binding protein [Gemmatimonadota bacterium]